MMRLFVGVKLLETVQHALPEIIVDTSKTAAHDIDRAMRSVRVFPCPANFKSINIFGKRPRIIWTELTCNGAIYEPLANYPEEF